MIIMTFLLMILKMLINKIIPQFLYVIQMVLVKNQPKNCLKE